MGAVTRELDDERVGVVEELLGADGTGAFGVRLQLLARHAVQAVEVGLVDAGDVVGRMADVRLQGLDERGEEGAILSGRGVGGERGELVLQELEEAGHVDGRGADARRRRVRVELVQVGGEGGHVGTPPVPGRGAWGLDAVLDCMRSWAVSELGSIQPRYFSSPCLGWGFSYLRRD